MFFFFFFGNSREIFTKNMLKSIAIQQRLVMPGLVRD